MCDSQHSTSERSTSYRVAAAPFPLPGSSFLSPVRPRLFIDQSYHCCADRTTFRTLRTKNGNSLMFLMPNAWQLLKFKNKQLQYTMTAHGFPWRCPLKPQGKLSRPFLCRWSQHQLILWASVFSAITHTGERWAQKPCVLETASFWWSAQEEKWGHVVSLIVFVYN